MGTDCKQLETLENIRGPVTILTIHCDKMTTELILLSFLIRVHLCSSVVSL